jgi:superfamily II DNA/RNA helicase
MMHCVEVHHLVPAAERSANIAAFRKGIANVMVCTDIMARGHDFSRVRHVVQAQFALNVAAHLHRVGRAARIGTGCRGRATNFYCSRSEELVRSVLGDTDFGRGDAGCRADSTATDVIDATLSSSENEEQQLERINSIEQSFSRRRGFRKRIRKQNRDAVASIGPPQ